MDPKNEIPHTKPSEVGSPQKWKLPFGQFFGLVNKVDFFVPWWLERWGTPDEEAANPAVVKAIQWHTFVLCWLLGSYSITSTSLTSIYVCTFV